jgi:hypothetical protein
MSSRHTPGYVVQSLHLVPYFANCLIPADMFAYLSGTLSKLTFKLHIITQLYFPFGLVSFQGYSVRRRASPVKTKVYF